MTLKNKIIKLFKKPKPEVKVQPYIGFKPETKPEVSFMNFKKEVTLKELEKELEPWNNSALYDKYMAENPGKKALYGGKETKGFLKWKEDNNL